MSSARGAVSCSHAAACILEFDELGDERLHHPLCRLLLSQTMANGFRVHVEASADRSSLVGNLPTVVRPSLHLQDASMELAGNSI